ncbi:MAG: Xaa-Pro dipeptidase [Xanthomonadales bacterium]|nr:Xaa-Pro dipeptidase [Gammaproteobacteria bacterium]NND57759.1 Xaa-Pro dipeptidase [Xanthomonadales bacterium]NNK51474.1 Xaa-Pro dipeptidase [Xanthomonadales bacterium]
MELNYRSHYAAHVAEMQKRWELALEAESFMAALVHSGSPMYSFLDDYEYAFRPNPHFLAWLPLTSHPDSVLLVVPGKRPTLFYFQPVDYWYLPPSDPEAYWADHFNIEIVRDSADWSKALKSHLPDADPGLGDVAAIGDSPSLQAVFDDKWINPAGLIDRLHLARTRKTSYEVACIGASADRAARAHIEAERAFREGESEYGIHMRYLAACDHTDAQLPYGNIVALNSHGSVLHYQARERKAPEKSLSFLIDGGCTVNAYASDITRTYAREPGVFADLVAAMDAMQQELTAKVRAGLDYKELHLETHRRIAQLLESFQIINVDAEEAVGSGLSSVFYPHGLGHFLGLQTHDVAGLIDNRGHEIPRPDGHPFLRLTRVLEAGNVLTIEPGLYFIAPLLEMWREEREPSMINWARVEELAPYGGVRIEDNIHVTETGGDNLTRAAFARLQ